MEMSQTDAYLDAFTSNASDLMDYTSRPSSKPLPFSVRIARTQKDLEKAIQIRHSAYARHLPTFAEMLKKPEVSDTAPGTVILVAESKLDGSPLGTLRIESNHYRPLTLERSVTLPEHLRRASLAEITRLGIAEGRIGRVVKIALFKALLIYCLAQQIEWMVICARSPLDRLYEGLLFVDVLPSAAFTPMPHIGNLPHRVMSLEVASVERQWRQANHALYTFFFQTFHHDIQLFNTQADFSPPAMLGVDLHNSSGAAPETLL